MKKRKIDFDASFANTQDNYFANNKELFGQKVDIKMTIIFTLLGIICAGLAYYLWSDADSITSAISESRKANKANTFYIIAKWITPVLAVIFLLPILFGGSKSWVNKKTGEVIVTDYLVKYIHKDHYELRELFESEKWDEILALPAESSYYTGIGDLSTFRLANDESDNKFYAFLEYRNDEEEIEGTIIHEHLPPKIISEPNYSEIKPMVEQNKILADNAS